MAREHLTDKGVKAAQPPAKGVAEIVDGAARGLVLRITAGGVKSWGLRYRFANTPKRLALGRYPDMSLKDAREAAAAALQQVRQGMDPGAPTPSEPVAEPAPVVLVKEAVDRFVSAQRSKGNKSAGEQARVLRLHLVPQLGERDIRSVSRRDVYALLERMREARGEDGRPLYGPQVNRTLTHAKTFFGWAVEAGEIESNPAEAIKRFVKEQARERALSAAELVKVIKAADGRGHPVAPLVRLLVLTGQRREEVTGMRWPEVDLSAALWTIPKERTKAKREHRVPLSTAAVAILEAAPRFADCDFVFPATHRKSGYQGWVKAAQRLKGAAALEQEWTLHDLRRTFATRMGEDLDIDEGLIARILNHSPRARLGITATYERSGREAAMRAALEAWSAYVDGLLCERPAASNIVPMRGGAA